MAQRMHRAAAHVRRAVYNVSVPADAARAAEIARTPFDVIIAGAGPAGLAMAHELSQRKIRSVLLERGRFLETDKVFALPYPIVERYGLAAAVQMRHRDTYFRNYFGLNAPTHIDYCLMDQRKVLSLLASRIDDAYCTVVENCELTAFARDGLVIGKTVVNDYRTLRYSVARKSFPRSTSRLNVDDAFFQKHDPLVTVNAMDELDNIEKERDNMAFRARMIVDAGGYHSNLVRSFHRQRSCTVLKCLMYEFSGLKRPQPEIIWDLAMPTVTSANFWVDVFGPKSAGAGVMVFTETTPGDPAGEPPSEEMERYLSSWLNIRKLSGNFERERKGIIPMTDFREASAYDNILFIGASATRQIPDTGFGFAPSLEEASLAAPVIEKALAAGDTSVRMLREYDIAWLRSCEKKMALNKFFQGFHYAIRRDEYFHEFAKRCTELPSEIIQRRIANDLTGGDLRTIAAMFVKNPYLLHPSRFESARMPELKRDLARFLYCLVSQALGFYVPEGSEMFDREPLSGSMLKRMLLSMRIYFGRRIPETILCKIGSLLFKPCVQAVIGIIGGQKR
ncbi:MAG: lycopene cyclase family protein [Spirochaetota bacterium]